jgi:glutathione S-transferase
MTINPKGAVPAIRLEDGQLLTEAAVIQQYIADADGVPAHVSAQYQSMDENRRSRALDLASRATNARDVEGYRRELELFEWVC